MYALSPRSYPRLAIVFVVALAVGLSLPGAALAQKKSFFDKTDKSETTLKTNPKFLEVFRPAILQARASTLRILCDGDDRALGVVVSTDGFILTQGHDLEGKITVKLKNGKEKSAEIVGVNLPYDLALLKVDASDLKPIVWADSKQTPVGNWVASVGTEADPVAVGVVSVSVRGPVPMRPGAKSGYMGIALSDEPTGGAKIQFVEPKGAAEKAGIKPNDVVLAVAGRKTPDAEALIHTVLRHKVGEIVELKIKRGEEELAIKVTLGKRDMKKDISEIQNNMGSRLSKVRGGYPLALQHDTVLPPTECGSPLVNLDGQVIGLNISRYGRVETYAIPAEVVRPLLADLMTAAKKSATSPVSK